MDELAPTAAGPAAATAGGARRLTTTVAVTSLVLLSLSYVVNAMDRQVFPVLLPDINKGLGFSLSQGGLLATIFTLGLGLAGLPTGYLLDRLSRKATIVIGIGIYSVFTVLTALSVGFLDMFAYRTLSGVGEGMQNAALFAAVGAYFFANRALALGSLNFAYGVGSFLGPQLGSRLGQAYSWKIPFVAYGLVGIALMVLVFVFISRRFTEQVDVQKGGLRQSYDHVYATLYNRNVLLMALTAAAVGVAGYGYLGLYPTFLRNALGFTPGQAGTAAGIFGLGALVGLPAGFIGDRVNQKTVLIGSLLAGAVVGYLIFNGPTGVGAQYVLSFLQGAIASGFLFVNLYSAIQRSVRPHFVGRASGVFVTALYVPSSVAGYLFARLQQHLGWGGAGVVQISVLLVMAAGMMLFVDPQRFSNAPVAASH